MRTSSEHILGKATRPILSTLLDDVVAKALEPVDIDDLEQDGGEGVLSDILGIRLLDVAAHDRPGEDLTNASQAGLARRKRFQPSAEGRERRAGRANPREPISRTWRHVYCSFRELVYDGFLS